MELNFRSDNESPAAPEIMAAIIGANEGSAAAYGADVCSRNLDQIFSDLFETPTSVLPLSTGTAANSIALACVTPPWGAVFCHDQAHIMVGESGAPEFYGNGLRLVGITGENGKIDPAQLSGEINSMRKHGIHNYQPAALSLTQCTELGTVYSPIEISVLTRIAKKQGLATHMDGARFANAVVSLGCAPADITWRVGIDMLSFGASKNGCFGAEALVFFNQPELMTTARRLCKRSGHLLSKMRYVAAQLQAYTKDDLWLSFAQRSNDKAASLARAIARHPGVELAYATEANEVFVRFDADQIQTLQAQGVVGFAWPGHDGLVRFVFSCTSPDADCERLESILDLL